MADQVSRRGLAAQVFLSGCALLLLDLLFVALVQVAPSFGALLRQEPIRVPLLGVVLVALAVILRLAFAGEGRLRTVVAGTVLAAVILVAFGPVLLGNLGRPEDVTNFVVSVLFLLGMVYAVAGGLIAAVEARRAHDLLPRPPFPEFAAPVGLALVVALVATGTGLAAAATNGRGPSPGLGAQSSGQGPSPVTAAAKGATVTSVAQGTVAQLPPGTWYISVVALTGPIPPATEPGILYSKNGTAAYVDPAAQSGPATGSPPEALFINVRPSDKRSTPPFQGASARYASDDLPSLPRLNQVEALELVKLAKGGYSALKKSGGVETIIALNGSVEVDAGTLPGPRTLKVGEAVTVLEGTPIRLFNRGSGEASYLAFFLLPSGRPLEVDITKP